MIKLTLKDGSIFEIPQEMSCLDVASRISQGLKKAAVAAVIDDQVIDLREMVTADCNFKILTFDDPQGKKVLRHSASHLLAAAVLKLFPETKLGVGPSTDTGFFYDFKVEEAFTPADLKKIENEMRRIVKSGAPIEKYTLGDAQAKEMMANQPFKLELIAEHSAAGDQLSFYKMGDFVDLCAGPHLMNASQIKAFKLTQTTGAYWKGDAENPQMSRVYGTAFTKADDLEAYLEAVKEAKKRDHNVIGRSLSYFTTADAVGQGLPLLMPKGAKVVQLLQRWIEDEEERRGYLLTKTPMMAKSELYKISGHWDHYREGMFVIGDEEKGDEVMALRPMTCPFQFMIYNNDMHSYRDLPIRYAETSNLFRNESSGEMHGLIRVRQFAISEGHLVVTPDQLKDEFLGVVSLVQYIMDTLGLSEDLTYRFSKWDPDNREKYIDDPKAWEAAQIEMKDILDSLDMDYTEAIGEAAFYGPKLDIQIKNVHGKEDTLITIQIDFSLPRRFEMVYTDSDGEKKTPYIIHRTSIGCYERTLALLIEKYAGAMPTWLAPTQAIVLPISDAQAENAADVVALLKKNGIRATLDSRNEKIGYKIREAQLEKIPYMIIIGDKEIESRTLSVRNRKEGDVGAMTAPDFIAKITAEITSKQI